jgi:PAS domain S-box-containing protein
MSPPRLPPLPVRPLPVRYGMAVLSVTVAVLIKLPLDPLGGVDTPFLLFLGAVMVAAWFGGWGPGVLALVVAVALADYFFLPPIYSFGIAAPSHQVGLVLFILEAILIIWLAERLRLLWRRTEESREQFRLLVEGTRDYALFLLDADGRVAGWNWGAMRVLGYTADEVLGRPLACFYVEEDVQRGTPSYDLRLAAEQGRLEDDGWRLRQDGTRFWASIVLTALRDEDGRLRGYSNLLRDVTRHKELEKEVLEIASREQRRIGQDLHDGTGQELTGLSLMAESLVESLHESGANEEPLAARIAAGLKRALCQVRALSRGLVPVEVDAEGLMAALVELAARVSEVSGVRCRFECSEPVRIEDTQTATHLYRIAQEAVTNAVKHGKAHNVRVGLEAFNGRVILEVCDDGVGVEQVRLNGSGMGLRIMEYRAGLIGAALYVGKAAPGGTLVQCTLLRDSNHDRH